MSLNEDGSSEFRPWESVINRVSYRQDELKILPYVILDFWPLARLPSLLVFLYLNCVVRSIMSCVVHWNVQSCILLCVETFNHVFCCALKRSTMYCVVRWNVQPCIVLYRSIMLSAASHGYSVMYHGYSVMYNISFL